MDDKKYEELKKIGAAAYDSIKEMVAALECDYERLEELRDERDGWEVDWEAAVREHPGFIGFENDVVECQADPGNPEATSVSFDDWEEAAEHLEIQGDWGGANGDDAEELKDLEEAAGECENTDAAREKIDEDPLSVEVRGGWHSPGGEDEAVEYKILLATGGPAVQIIGELGQGDEPSTARLQVQDWFTPWTDYFDADVDVLLAYARCFYFSDSN